VRVVFGDFALDRGNRQLLREGDETCLGPKAFELLDLLLRQRPKPVSKASIRDELWSKPLRPSSTATRCGSAAS